MQLKKLYKVIEGLHGKGQKIDLRVIDRLVRECSKITNKAEAKGILTKWCMEDKII